MTSRGAQGVMMRLGCARASAARSCDGHTVEARHARVAVQTRIDSSARYATPMSHTAPSSTVMAQGASATACELLQLHLALALRRAVAQAIGAARCARDTSAQRIRPDEAANQTPQITYRMLLRR